MNLILSNNLFYFLTKCSSFLQITLILLSTNFIVNLCHNITCYVYLPTPVFVRLNFFFPKLKRTSFIFILFYFFNFIYLFSFVIYGVRPFCVGSFIKFPSKTSIIYGYTSKLWISYNLNTCEKSTHKIKILAKEL